MGQELAIGVKDAALRVGLSPWTLRAWIRTGKLGSVRLGRRVLIEPSELHRLVEQGRKREDETAYDIKDVGAKR
jgi:excisionase family DNA binding protein